mmetsp:Transcript_10340/g.18227  ORF Transcript_10340/g.18227 Transcript_10340/m.18227 type:complete len:235 (-) Transcript_10340:1113-1817(-)
MEEAPVHVNVEHYPNGLNATFLRPREDAEEMRTNYGQGVGRFENTETREIAARKNEIVQVCERFGLAQGGSVVDLGAGTGLFLDPLARIVGKDGKIYATEISEGFGVLLEEKCQANQLLNDTVQVSIGTEKTLAVPDDVADVILICDVYHHFNFPRTILQECLRVLRKEGKLVLVDFHRDSSKITSHEPGWVEDHVRADQATFRSEIESSGFTHLEDIHVEGLHENYCMVFDKQ